MHYKFFFPFGKAIFIPCSGKAYIASLIADDSLSAKFLKIHLEMEWVDLGLLP